MLRYEYFYDTVFNGQDPGVIVSLDVTMIIAFFWPKKSNEQEMATPLKSSDYLILTASRLSCDVVVRNYIQKASGDPHDKNPLIESKCDFMIVLLLTSPKFPAFL